MVAATTPRKDGGSSRDAKAATPSASADDALATGNYEVLKRRLDGLAEELAARANRLNERRKTTFGGTELTVIGNERIRTENNCIPADVVALGDHLLVGYTVFLGLRTEFALSDVFTMHRFEEVGGEEGGAHGFDFSELNPDEANPGLFSGANFQREFDELRKYYKDARLIQLRKTDKLLAVFQVGATHRDVKVLRWQLSPSGVATYLDNRGERDHTYPSSHSFPWTRSTREDQRRGRYPHISVRDKVFVETTGGDLTIKVEDNTETGRGIYAEPVDDKNQSLDDMELWWAELGTLILLRIKPFRENAYRHLVYNTRSKKAVRIDAIGQACVALPEDQGILFPGGYYLQTGEYKLFELETKDLEFKRQIASPNGEDVLYVFHHRQTGEYLLFPYNLIRREVQNPIACDGYSLFPDGRMVVLRHVGREAVRVHPVQVWRTPFCSPEFAAGQKGDGSYLTKVGNADLVRGISESFALVARIRHPEPSRERFEDIIAHVGRMSDGFHWLGHGECEELSGVLGPIRQNVEQIIDEFEKVLALRKRANEALEEARAKQSELEKRTDYQHWKDIDRFMLGMSALRTQRGHLISLREVRYIDLEAIDRLEKKTAELFDAVSKAAVVFLSKNDALSPFGKRLDELLAIGHRAVKVADLEPTRKGLEDLARGLEVLSETIATLQVDDPTVRTQILEGLSETFAHMNRVRAEIGNRKRELSEAEDKAEFVAQFRLFGQAASTSIAMSETPEACDAALSRLLVQLEELEGRFSEHEGFIAELGGKREEVYEAFAAKKQALLDQKQKKIAGLAEAGKRILEGVARRARTFKSEDELNAYFAADAMVQKLRQLADQLLELGDSVKSDEILSRLKAARQDGLRGLRDKLELFEEGADIIRLGRHRFLVNTQTFDMTVVPRDGGLALHLTGTDFYEPVEDPTVAESRRFWDQTLVSETAEVYRAEFLAGSILLDAEAGVGHLGLSELVAAERGEGATLGELVRGVANQRYAEGYERGIHDADATKILQALIDMMKTAGRLRFAPNARALASLWWSRRGESEGARFLQRRALSLATLGQSRAKGAGPSMAKAATALAGEVATAVGTWLVEVGIDHAPGDVDEAARLLVSELGREPLAFTTSAESDVLRDKVRRENPRLDEDLRALEGDLAGALRLVSSWVEAVAEIDPARFGPYRLEAAALCLTEGLARETSQARVAMTLEGMLGQHPRVTERKLELRLDELLSRISSYRAREVPAYRRFREELVGLIERRKRELRINEMRPQILSSFVRNQLLTEVYLPLIGANLAKQIGAAGDAKRTDLMGLLLLISPPGYGKTTLMEYVASRLGMVFVKVNGPALGHDVKSLDPNEAPNATARQEIERLNFALEMGNNVMLLVDDIQHTHPEFLQKFISLCDGQRKIEGVWRGRTKTYDMRGRKFCVVMAGNPYTESGEAFKIPDMLANRADIYNLGDILDGKRDQFALSYLENSLTANPVLAPLAARDQADIIKLIRMARGEPVATTDLSHGYSAAELSEIISIFKLLFRCQEVLLAVNLQYIASAATADAYRTEPPFKLQGSYRNMNKLSEKVVAALTGDELERLLDDHYQGEAQTLTTGAESNLLKLKELRGRLTPDERARWEAIKSEYVRRNQLGGKEDDPATRVTSQLSLVGRELGAIRAAVLEAAQRMEQARLAEAEAESQRAAALASAQAEDRDDEELDDGAERLAETLSELGAAIMTLREALKRPLAVSLPAGLVAGPVVGTSQPPPVPGRPGTPAVGAGAGAVGADLRPVMERLAQVLSQVTTPEVRVEVAPPDMAGFFAHQHEVLRDALIPVARAATRNLDETTALTREVLSLLGGLEGHKGATATPAPVERARVKRPRDPG